MPTFGEEALPSTPKQTLLASVPLATHQYIEPVRYLSEEWIAAADAHMQAAASTAPTGRVVIDQVVEGMASYRVSIEANDASIRMLDVDQEHTTADARFVQSAQTAAAVAQGRTDAHQAFLLGEIRFTGDVNVLIERRSSFEWLESTLAPLLAQTVFD